MTDLVVSEHDVQSNVCWLLCQGQWQKQGQDIYTLKEVTELSKMIVREETTFHIEIMSKRKNERGPSEVVVWPKTFNSWILKQDVYLYSLKA